MPTYQYACTACNHQLEAVQSFTDDPLTQCPACDGQLRKLFGSVGIVFKGPGFYRTDSRAGANGNGNGANQPSADSKDGGAKDSGAKDSGSKDGGSKDGGAKDGGAKDGGGKDRATKEKATTTAAASSSSS